jgi:Flp pilus assembly protein CpaB
VPGDRVDVLVATQGRPDAEVVVRAATVLAGPATTSDSGDLLSGEGGLGAGGLGAGGVDTSGGGLLVLAVESVQAARLAGAAARGVLSITLLPAPPLPPP